MFIQEANSDQKIILIKVRRLRIATYAFEFVETKPLRSLPSPILLGPLGSLMREKPDRGTELSVPVRLEPYLVLPLPRDKKRERKERPLKSLDICLKRGRREGRHDAMR